MIVFQYVHVTNQLRTRTTCTAHSTNCTIPNRFCAFVQMEFQSNSFPPFLHFILVFVHRVAVWSTNTLRNVGTSQSAANARKSLRASGHRAPANVHACQSVRRPLPVHTVASCAINAYVNVSFVHSWSKNRKSWKCWADHQKLAPPKSENATNGDNSNTIVFIQRIWLKMK